MPNLKKLSFVHLPLLAVLAGAAGSLYAGPYSAGTHDSTNAWDAPVPGFVGPDGVGYFSQTGDSANYVNPLYLGWASSVVEYDPAENPNFTGALYPETAILGPVTGDVYDIAALGEPPAADWEAGTAEPGTITVSFDRAIKNLQGADFTVYENGFAQYDFQNETLSELVLAELAYVEVSSNGLDWARFPSDSQTPSKLGSYAPLDPTNVYNLVGKHVNAYTDYGNASWGTPFDLSTLEDEQTVIDGLVDLNAIWYVRIVDIPGNGDSLDASGDPIYDGYPQLFGALGADIEAIGQINVGSDFNYWRSYFGLGVELATSDSDGDQIPLLLEYAFGLDPLHYNADAPFGMQYREGQTAFVFRRDVRAEDLTYIVQSSPSLSVPDWQEIARSEAGASVTTSMPEAFAVSEVSASDIYSVQSVREVRITALNTPPPDTTLFYRVLVESAP